jgi:N-(2-amino-2-carboxyethyl)-L-glutamate synthase
MTINGDQENAALQGILSLVGHTPLVEFTRLFDGSGIHFWAKLEQFNPAGSTKDRPALNIIRRAMQAGVIGPETVVIESSSGNMGLGLAQICSYYKLRFICVVDAKTTAQNIALLRAYNAEVEVVREPDPETGEYLPARLRRAQELSQIFTNSFWPNQYANEDNSRAHYQTMDEIVTRLGGRLDYLFAAISTCGTLRGCAEYKKQHGLATRIIAVDAVGSVISGQKKAKRLIPGHGAAVLPPLYCSGLADDFVHVSDLECVVGCHRLLEQEAVLAGGSSGGIVSAVERYLPNISHGAVCAAILPDRGERYLDTIYSHQWVTEHFGDVSHLWKIPSITCSLTTSATY